MPVENTVFIDRIPIRKQGQDYASLREEGVAILQKLCGALWTDFNEHDPGITILEELCYAITELSFRSQRPIEKLLEHAIKSQTERESGFYSAPTVFCSSPVTPIDYSRLLIDQCTLFIASHGRDIQLSNAWIEPILAGEYLDEYLGGFKVVLQPWRTWLSEASTEWEAELREKALDVLSAHRNIGESFLEVKVLLQAELLLKLDVEIAINHNPEEVLAEIFFRLDDWLQQPVLFSHEAELKEAGLTLEEIYEGPRLESGIIPRKNLKLKRKSVDLSEMFSLVSEIPGVQTIYTIDLDFEDESMGKASQPAPIQKLDHELKVVSDHFVCLAMPETYQHSISLRQNGFEVPVRLPVVTELVDQLRAAHYRRYRITPEAEKKRVTEAISASDLKNKYRSIQFDFPLTYQLGQEGLRHDADKAERSKVRQLKAYLALFEQHLINYLAQLEHVGDLFSPELKEEAQSYFDEVLYGVPGVSPLFVRDGDEEKPPADRKGLPLNSGRVEAIKQAEEEWLEYQGDALNPYRKILSEARENRSLYLNRKARVLDHLLARFGEQYDEIGRAVYGKYFTDQSLLEEFRLDGRKELLDYLAENGHHRAATVVDSDRHSSGLSEKFGVGIYLKSESPKDLAKTRGVFEIAAVDFDGNYNRSGAEKYDENIAHVRLSNTDLKFLEELSSSPISTSLSKLTLVAEESYLNGAFFVEGMETERFATAQFSRNGNEATAVTFRPGSGRSRFIMGWVSSQAEAVKSINSFIAKLRVINQKEEQYYTIDHSLLRPAKNKTAYSLDFIDINGNRVLSSRLRLPYDERQSFLDKLLHFGSDIKNYRFEMQNYDEYRIVIVDEMGKTVARGVRGYKTDVGIDQSLQIKKLYRQVLDFKVNPREANLTTRTIYTTSSGMRVPCSFFNYHFSFLLPSWPARFQDESFRNYTETFIRREAAVYHNVKLYWVDREELATYKELFGEYGSNKESAASELLIEFLAKLDYKYAQKSNK